MQLKNSRQPLVDEVKRLREAARVHEGERENLVSEVEYLRAKVDGQKRENEAVDNVVDVHGGNDAELHRLEEENASLRAHCDKVTRRCDAAVEDAERLKRQLVRGESIGITYNQNANILRRRLWTRLHACATPPRVTRTRGMRHVVAASQ